MSYVAVTSGGETTAQYQTKQTPINPSPSPETGCSCLQYVSLQGCGNSSDQKWFSPGHLNVYRGEFSVQLLRQTHVLTMQPLTFKLTPQKNTQSEREILVLVVYLLRKSWFRCLLTSLLTTEFLRNYDKAADVGSTVTDLTGDHTFDVTATCFEGPRTQKCTYFCMCVYTVFDAQNNSWIWNKKLWGHLNQNKIQLS